MRLRSFFALVSMLLISVSGTSPANAEAEAPTTALIIDCSTNEITIAGFRTIIGQLIVTATPLRHARQKKQLTEEQNTELFQLETAIAEHLVKLIRHEHAQFYCDNLELLEEEQSPPVDPASVV
jgi:hypothetical protein